MATRKNTTTSAKSKAKKVEAEVEIEQVKPKRKRTPKKEETMGDRLDAALDKKEEEEIDPVEIASRCTQAYKLGQKAGEDPVAAAAIVLGIGVTLYQLWKKNHK